MAVHAVGSTTNILNYHHHACLHLVRLDYHPPGVAGPYRLQVLHQCDMHSLALPSAGKMFFIRSKNNNNITGIAESVKHKKGRISLV